MIESQHYLEGLLSEYPVILFVYGADESQYSSVARSAIAITLRFAPDVHIYNVSRNKPVRDAIRKASGWDFFPQLFVYSEFIGGISILDEFFHSLEYNRILSQKGRKTVNPALMRRRETPSTIWRFAYDSALNTLVGASADGTVRVWLNNYSAPPLVYKVSDGWVNCVTLLPGTEFVFSGQSDGTIRRITINHDEPVLTIDAHERWVNDIHARPLAKEFYSVSADRTIKRWNSDGELLASAENAHSSCIWCVAVDATGTVVATGGGDGRVKFWDADTLQLINEVHCHVSCVTSITKLRAGFCSTSYDGSAVIFSDDFTVLQTYAAHSERVWTAAIVKGTELCVTASGDGTVRVWDAQSASTVWCKNFTSMPIAVSHVAEAGLLCVSHEDGSVSWHKASRYGIVEASV